MSMEALNDTSELEVRLTVNSTWYRGPKLGCGVMLYDAHLLHRLNVKWPYLP